jgi:hypothetical protein
MRSSPSQNVGVARAIALVNPKSWESGFRGLIAMSTPMGPPTRSMMSTLPKASWIVAGMRWRISSATGRSEM